MYRLTGQRAIPRYFTAQFPTLSNRVLRPIATAIDAMEGATPISSQSENGNEDGEGRRGGSVSTVAVPLSQPVPTTAVLLQMPWGSTGSDGYPFFTGRNVSRFLSEYDALGDRNQCAPETRAEGVPRFSSEMERERLRGLEEWEARDWERLKEKMRKEYRGKDEEQQMLTSEYLSRLSARDRSCKEDIHLYLQQFRKAANHLLNNGAETHWSCCRLFVEGLPESFREKIVSKQQLDPEDPKTANFENCYQQAVKLWEKEYKTNQFSTGGVGELDFDELVEMREAQPSMARARDRKERRDRAKRRESERGQSAIDTTASSAAKAASATKKAQFQAVQDHEIDSLTRQMGALTLPIQAQIAAEVMKYFQQQAMTMPVQAAPQASSTMLRRPPNAPQYNRDEDYGIRDPNSYFRGTQRREPPGGNRRPIVCWFCEGPHPRSACPDLQCYFDRKQIHINDQRELALGPWKPGTHAPSIEFPENAGVMQKREILYNAIQGISGQGSSSNPSYSRQDSRGEPFQAAPRPQGGATVKPLMGLMMELTEDDEDFGRAAVGMRSSAPIEESSLHDRDLARLDVVKRQTREQAQYPATKHVRTGHYVHDTGPPAAVEITPGRKRGRREAPPPKIVLEESRDKAEISPDGVRRNLIGRDSALPKTEVPNARPEIARRKACDNAEYSDELLEEVGLAAGEKLQKTFAEVDGADRLVQMCLEAELPEKLKVKHVMSGSAEARDKWYKGRGWQYDLQSERFVQGNRSGAKIGKVSDSENGIRMDALGDKRPVRNPYLEKCPYISILTRTGYENALLDTGAEINVMSRDLMMELGLQRSLVPAKVVSRPIGWEGKAGEQFLGMLEGLWIHCAGVECRTHVYVANTLDPSYRLILGAPYQVASRAVILRNDDGDCDVILKDQNTDKSVRVRANEADYTQDRKMNEMFDISHGRLNA